TFDTMLHFSLDNKHRLDRIHTAQKPNVFQIDIGRIAGPDVMVESMAPIGVSRRGWLRGLKQWIKSKAVTLQAPRPLTSNETKYLQWQRQRLSFRRDGRSPVNRIQLSKAWRPTSHRVSNSDADPTARTLRTSPSRRGEIEYSVLMKVVFAHFSIRVPVFKWPLASI